MAEPELSDTATTTEGSARADRAAERLEAVARITGAVIRSASLDEVLERIVTGVRGALRSTTATLLLEEGGVLTVRASSGVAPDHAAAVRIRVGEGFAGTIAARRQSLAIPEVLQGDVRGDYLRRSIRSMLGVPLIADGELVGVLHVGSSSARAFTDDERVFLELVGVPAAAAIVRARLYEAERHARQAAETAARRTARLQEVTAALSRALPKDQVVNVMLGPALRALGATAGVVVDAAGGGFVVLAAAGDEPAGCATWTAVRGGGGPVAHVARTLEPVFLESRAAWQRSFGEQPDEECGHQSWAVLPLRVGDRLLGVLAAGFPEQQRFTDHERGYTLAVTHQCVQALERARLYEVEKAARRRAESAARRATALEHASALLASSLDYERTVGHIGELIVPEFADFCQVYLTEGEELRRVGATAVSIDKLSLFDDLARRPALRIDGASPQAEAVRTGESRLIPSASEDWLRGVSEDSEHYHLLSRLGIRSLIAAPLHARASVIGAFAIGRFAPDPAFTEEDRVFAQELGRRAGMAVENARLYQELNEANEAKSRFLSTMSHELRTPLNAIIGYASLLRDDVPGPLNRTQREHVGRILSASDHLLLLINDVLSLSRIEAGKEQVDATQCDGVTIAREVIELVEPIAVEKGLQLVVESPATLRLRTDETKVRQVLLNLLSNACKFCDAGTITLHVVDAEPEVVFRVTDTGPGIAPTELEHIFEPFYQISQGTTRAAGGTGLGLTVSRRLARVLGGDLTVESVPGAGSTFTLRLPHERGGERRAPQAPWSADGSEVELADGSGNG